MKPNYGTILIWVWLSILSVCMAAIGGHVNSISAEINPHPVLSETGDGMAAPQPPVSTFGDEPVVEPGPEESVTCTLHYRITCYGPPPFGGFPTSNSTARCLDGHCYTIQEGLDLAADLELDGICAVAPDVRWYNRVRDPVPVVIRIDGFGDYLVWDRTADWVSGVIDIYNPEIAQDNQWNESGVGCWEIPCPIEEDSDDPT